MTVFTSLDYVTEPNTLKFNLRYLPSLLYLRLSNFTSLARSSLQIS